MHRSKRPWRAVIGSETAAGVRDVLVQGCIFDGTDRGIRIKTRRGRGGEITNIHDRSLTMKDNLCPIAVNMYYRPGATNPDLFSLDPQPILDTTPSISNILIEECTAVGATSSAGFIVGLPEEPIRNVRIVRSSFGVSNENVTAIEERRCMMDFLPSASGESASETSTFTSRM